MPIVKTKKGVEIIHVENLSEIVGGNASSTVEKQTELIALTTNKQDQIIALQTTANGHLDELETLATANASPTKTSVLKFSNITVAPGAMVETSTTNVTAMKSMVMTARIDEVQGAQDEMYVDLIACASTGASTCLGSVARGYFRDGHSIMTPILCPFGYCKARFYNKSANTVSVYIRFLMVE